MLTYRRAESVQSRDTNKHLSRRVEREGTSRIPTCWWGVAALAEGEEESNIPVYGGSGPGMK